jgi:hypothetical protein
LQLADAPLPLKVHGEPVNVPVPLVVKVTVPVGVGIIPGEAAVTVAVHIVAVPTVTEDGVQVTPVETLGNGTARVAVPLLSKWIRSPW